MSSSSLSLLFLCVWYLIVCGIVYSFLWGDGVDHAYHINERIGFFMWGFEDKEKYRQFVKAFAVVFFVFAAFLFILLLRSE
jgi:hypothetical protein